MDIMIKVLGEYDDVQTRVIADSQSAAILKRQLRQAILSLEAEYALLCGSLE